MATKRPSSIRWARTLQRSLTALTRASVRAGSKALSATQPRTRPRRSAAPAERGWSSGVAISPAGSRGFQLFKPPGIGRNEEVPLLVMLHGCTQDARAFAASTRMNRVAVRERFAVLYPEQAAVAHAQRCWNWYDTRSGAAQREVEVLLAAIDQVCRLEPVDPTRVAIAGFSAGAGMAALFAYRHPDRVAAVAMHSGVAPGLADTTSSALAAMRGHHATAPQLQQRPGVVLPPLLAIHGSADHVVSASNSRLVATAWAGAVGAVPTPARSVQRGNRHPMSVIEHRRRGAVAVTLCEIERLAHAWSGGASQARYGDPAGPDASRMIWAFAARAFGRRLAAAA